MIKISKEEYIQTRQMIASNFLGVSAGPLSPEPDSPIVFIGEIRGRFLSVWEHPEGSYNLSLG